VASSNHDRTLPDQCTPTMEERSFPFGEEKEEEKLLHKAANKALLPRRGAKLQSFYGEKGMRDVPAIAAKKEQLIQDIRATIQSGKEERLLHRETELSRHLTPRGDKFS